MPSQSARVRPWLGSWQTCQPSPPTLPASGARGLSAVKRKIFRRCNWQGAISPTILSSCQSSFCSTHTTDAWLYMGIFYLGHTHEAGDRSFLSLSWRGVDEKMMRISTEFGPADSLVERLLPGNHSDHDHFTDASKTLRSQKRGIPISTRALGKSLQKTVRLQQCCVRNAMNESHCRQPFKPQHAPLLQCKRAAWRYLLLFLKNDRSKTLSEPAQRPIWSCN